LKFDNNSTNTNIRKKKENMRNRNIAHIFKFQNCMTMNDDQHNYYIYRDLINDGPCDIFFDVEGNFRHDGSLWKVGHLFLYLGHIDSNVCPVTLDNFLGKQGGYSCRIEFAIP
jgi:hypothetical protein